MVQDFMLRETGGTWVAHETACAVDGWFDDLCAIARRDRPEDERSHAYRLWCALPMTRPRDFDEDAVVEFLLTDTGQCWTPDIEQRSEPLFEAFCKVRRGEAEPDERYRSFLAWCSAPEGYRGESQRSALDYPDFRVIAHLAGLRSYVLPIIPFPEGPCVPFRQARENASARRRKREVDLEHSREV
jgi:hypothetical protein